MELQQQRSQLASLLDILVYLSEGQREHHLVHLVKYLDNENLVANRAKEIIMVLKQLVCQDQLKVDLTRLPIKAVIMRITSTLE